MDRKWIDVRFFTKTVRDNEEGWVAVELSRDAGGNVERIARVTFWDADGQFAFEMFVKEIPLTIVEELIAEGKRLYPARSHAKTASQSKRATRSPAAPLRSVGTGGGSWFVPLP